MKKRAIAAVLALVMASSLAACGGGSSAPAATTAAPAATTAAPAATTAAAAETKAAAETQAAAETKAEAPAAGGDYTPTGKNIVFKVGHVQPVDHPYHTGLVRTNELLTERTGGEITLDIYPSSQLGAERELCEGVQMGTVDIGLTTSPLANFDNSWFLFDIPGLFYTKQHAYDFLDGERGQAMLDGLAKINMKGLSFWETGFFNIFDDERLIEKPEDLAGLTIRTMENDAYITYFSKLGANPVPMAYSEVFTGIQNGTVDGTLIPIAAIYSMKFYTVAPYISRTQNWYCPVTVIMSMDAWNSMNEEQQKIFQECFNEGRDYMRQQLTDNEDAQIAQMESEGCTVLDIDKAAWREAEAEAVQAVKDQFVGKYVSQDDIDYIAELGKKYQ